MQNFRQLANYKYPKIEGGTSQKYKNWKNGENKMKFSKMEETKILVLETVNRKPYAKFQESSSIENTQKSRRTTHDVKISKSKNQKNGENTENISKIEKPKNQAIGNIIRKAHIQLQKANQLNGKSAKIEGNYGRDVKRLTKNLISFFDEDKKTNF